MTKKLIPLLLITLAVSLTNCLNYESRYDGQWQLQTVEADGDLIKVDTVWYRFQTILFNYKVYDPHAGIYHDCSGFINEYNDKKVTIQLQDKSFLKYTDWTSDERTFDVERISGGKLVLSSDGKRYTFRKF